MICSANQWPGFYMIGTSIIKELTIFTQSSMIIILQVPKFIQLGHFGYFPYYLLDLRKYLIFIEAAVYRVEKVAKILGLQL